MKGTIGKAGKVKKSTPIAHPKDRFKKLVVGRSKKRKQFGKKATVLSSNLTLIQRNRFRHNQQGKGTI